MSCAGSCFFISRAKYRPAGPPPIHTMFMTAPSSARLPCPSILHSSIFDGSSSLVQRCRFLAQFEALQLAGLGTWQAAAKFNPPRVFVGSDTLLDVVLQLLCQCLAGC